MMPEIGDLWADRYLVVDKGRPQEIGTAYEVYDVEADGPADLLVLDPGPGEDALARLEAGQGLVSDLAQPVLLPILEAGLIDGRLYLVREQVVGQSLAEALARTGPFSPQVAVEITIRLCQALVPVHRAGLVHGSLSAHSVLIGDDGRLAVADTGLLPALRPDPPPLGKPWGRFPYLSPEQAVGGEARPTSDVYVVGLLLYEMLAGELPFEATDHDRLARQHVRQIPTPLDGLVPAVPAPLAEIVHRALAKESAVRYRNAGQVAHLLRAQAGEQVAPPEDEAGPLLQERLLVPAPPEAGEGQIGAWEDEPEGVDWLLLALMVAALIAVLGLIPLWRTVRQRYAVPPPASGQPVPAVLIGDRPPAVNGGPELVEGCFLWYNSRERAVDGRGGSRRPAYRSFRLAHPCPARLLAIQANDRPVWESRLRDLAPDCSTLG
jgi:serine/threonine protein kinase